MMNRLALDGTAGQWVLQFAGSLEEVPAPLRGRDIPATVPGCVHTDLLASGLIPDPYLEDNESRLQWIGRTDARYSRTFDVPAALLAHERVELVCQGLDTIASVQVNGQIVGTSANMHHAHRFDVKSALLPGSNAIAVTFSSPDAYVERKRKALQEPDRPVVEYNVIRKMACNFGWDWGAKLTTSGIWQSIGVEAWDVARIRSVRPLCLRADEKLAVLDVHVDIEYARKATRPPLDLAVQLLTPNAGILSQTLHVDDGRTEAVVSFEVHHPKLWWPRGHGSQDLYSVQVALFATPQAEPLDEWSGRTGLRTVRLNHSPDPLGSKFQIEVNGKPIYCKGANWVPDDCFLPRIDKARYRRRLSQACQVNMNMLRVWGGGIFESDDFYDLCDEMGLLVWQDFLFACAMYPETDELKGLIEQEERFNIARLSCHPSLAIYCGNNENIWGFWDWGWQDKLQGRCWGEYYYCDLQPRLTAELDPSRPYWPGSPYSGAMDIHPNDDDRGNKHAWDVWNQLDFTEYRKHPARFVSEFGWQAAPTYATLARAIPADQRQVSSPILAVHQKASNGMQNLGNGIKWHFRQSENFDDWLYLTQLVQVRAITLGVEFWRSLEDRNMGCLYWQINDCWPVISWSSVDGDGRPKPLWFATARFYADRLLSIQPEGDGLALYAINDTDEPWKAEVNLSRTLLDGQSLARGQASFELPGRSCRRVSQIDQALAHPADGSREMLLAQAGDQRALWFFERDKDIAYPAPDFDATLSTQGQRKVLTIQAKTLLRDLAIFPDRLDARATISDQMVTLLSGETFRFEIQSSRPLTAEELTSPPVCQCANRFGKG